MKGHTRRRGTKWYYWIDRGADPATGRRRQVSKGGFRTEAEADKAMQGVMRDFETDRYVAPDKMIVRDYLLDEWLPAQQVRDSTRASYRRVLESRIIPHIGGTKLQALTPVDVNRLYRKLEATDNGRGAPLSKRSIQYAHTLLRKALADAQRLDYVRRNVADNVDAPKSRAADAPALKRWNVSQLQAFLNDAQADRLLALYFLAAVTGMRKSELLGLSWSNVDLKDGKLSVVRVLTKTDYDVSFGPPKTKRSKRTIKLDQATVAVLKAHRKAQAAERLVAHGVFENNDLVFCTELGKVIHPDRVSVQFTRRAKHLKLPLIGFRGLRHSFATLAIEAGEPMNAVSHRMGHFSPAVTLSIYAHVTGDMEESSAGVVSRLVAGQ